MSLGKPAQQLSAPFAKHSAGKAVDGIYVPTGHYHSSMSAGRTVSKPWWRVDLEAFYCVWAVKVLNGALGECTNNVNL